MTDIGPKRFRLIFRGKLEPETDPEAARRLFRERFRVGGQTLENCFSGRKVALRTGLEQAEAFRLQARLQEMGLVTHIEAMKGNGAPPPPGESVTQTPPPSAPEQGPATADAANLAAPAREAAMQEEPGCRQCHQPLAASALHCPFCGARQQPRGRVWPAMALLALLLLLLLPPLALVILPWWQQQDSADKVNAAVRQGEATVEKVRAFMERTGFRPNSNLDAGLAKPQELAQPPLSSIRISEGAMITLRLGEQLPELGGKTIVFVPQTDDRGRPGWLCRPGTLAADRLPPRCRPDSTGEPDTNPEPANGGEESEIFRQSEQVIKRVIREEISASAGIREAMLLYRQRRGQWPHNNADLGLAAPARLGTAAVRELRVLPGGELALTFITSLATDQAAGVVLYYREGDWICRSEMKKSVLPRDCQRDPDGSR